MSLIATMQATSHSKPRHTLSSVLIYLLILSTPYVLWHSLCVLSHTYSPIVVVTSESMEPVFRRGDVLFVSNRTTSIELGDIVVCWFEGRELPFVHRVIEKHRLPVVTKESDKYENLEQSRANTYGFLTKGDNSPLDDTVLYPLGQRYLDRSDLVGSVKGHVPHVGQLALLIAEFPWLKQALIVVSALLYALFMLLAFAEARPQIQHEVCIPESDLITTSYCEEIKTLPIEAKRALSIHLNRASRTRGTLRQINRQRGKTSHIHRAVRLEIHRRPSRLALHRAVVRAVEEHRHVRIRRLNVLQQTVRAGLVPELLDHGLLGPRGVHGRVQGPVFGLVDLVLRLEGLAPVVGVPVAVFADVAEGGAGAALLEGLFGDGRRGGGCGEVGLR